jgi:cyclopropane-fatty-acyl-phospholipid synthase
MTAQRALRIDHRLAKETLQLLKLLLRNFHPRDFAVELWDGTRLRPEKGQFCRFTWKIYNPDTLRTAMMSSNRQVALGEAYLHGDFDIKGDMQAIFPLADFLINQKWNMWEKLNLTSALLAVPGCGRKLASREEAHLQGPLHSKRRDQQAISYHYDVSNDFYRLWLDRNMVYSCAHFEHPQDDLQTAQRRKLDDICRTLRLQPGERFLDIGCGWGALILHAAREYGVQSLGITLSRQQMEFADARIREARLSDRCRVRLLDYRDLDEYGAYDKLASVGMVEHVGESKLAEYFRHAFRLLRSGGAFFNSGIGRAEHYPKSNQPTFTELYVFPDGELVTIAAMLASAEQAGFEVHKVENLREDYRLTVRQWLQRLESTLEEAQGIVGDLKYRLWRLYLAGSIYYFQKAWLGLYELLLLKNENGWNGFSSSPGS